MMNMVNVISRKNEFAGRIRIHDENQAPSTNIRIFLKTEIFPSVLAFGPHVNGVFENRKRKFSKNVLQSAFFCKRRFIVFVWTDENRVLRMQ